jgi:hypothetical protein
MGTRVFTNNASSTLASGITSGDLSLTLNGGDGALFPAPSGGQYALCTLESAAGVIEVVRLTARTGDICTITRAQEGTAAAAFSSGARFELRVTRGILESFAQKDGETYTGTHAFPATVTFNGINVTEYARTTQTNVFTALQEIQSTTPTLQLDESDAPANERSTLIRKSGGFFFVSSATDAAPTTPVANLLTAERVGTAWNTADIAATTFTINGAAVTPPITSGTYTPTITNVTNVTSSSALVCQWLRIGNVVTVSGSVDVDPVATGVSTVIRLSLPVASNFATAGQLGGSCGNVAFTSSHVGPDAINDAARLEFFTSFASVNSISFTFTYLVV